MKISAGQSQSSGCNLRFPLRPLCACPRSKTLIYFLPPPPRWIFSFIKDKNFALSAKARRKRVAEEGYKNHLNAVAAPHRLLPPSNAPRQHSERQASGAESRAAAKANGAHTTHLARPSGRWHQPISRFRDRCIGLGRIIGI